MVVDFGLSALAVTALHDHCSHVSLFYIIETEGFTQSTKIQVTIATLQNLSDQCNLLAKFESHFAKAQTVISNICEKLISIENVWSEVSVYFYAFQVVIIFMLYIIS